MQPPDSERIQLLDTGGVGAIELLCRAPAGLHVTPASRVTLAAVGSARGLLAGKGLDWGSGTGGLAIAAARLEAVESVLGLEIHEGDVELARRNAVLNGVESKVDFHHADSFVPRTAAGREALAALRGRAGFLLANPPASREGDGLGWRRAVLAGAGSYLRPGSPLLIQISYQYSERRMRSLAEEVSGMTYEGVLATSDWVIFDQDRPDLRRQLLEYAQEERATGLVYTFADPAEPETGRLDAREALRRYLEGGEHPLTRWQAHLYRYDP